MLDLICLLCYFAVRIHLVLPLLFRPRWLPRRGSIARSMCEDAIQFVTLHELFVRPLQSLTPILNLDPWQQLHF